MNILLFLLFAKLIHGAKLNPIKIARGIKKGSKGMERFFKNLVQLISFTTNGLNSIASKTSAKKVVKNQNYSSQKDYYNVIDIIKFKLKKAE